jgi:nickel-dependent lactate racemase
MEYSLPYGKRQLTVSLPDGLTPDLIAPVDAAPVPDALGAVAAAIESPIGGRRLDQFAGVDSVAIAINDKTRPVPHQQLLPPLLDRLASIGIAPGAITFIIATGTHVPMRPDEFAAVVPPDLLSRYRVISHDGDDESQLIDLGITGRGSSVKVNRHFYEADLRITVGNIEPHQFAGFSGGVKTAAIGLGGRAGINNNHSLMMLPASRIGDYETNPARQDIEAMGAKIGVHFSLNAILNSHKQIVHALFGDPLEVMRVGLPLSRGVCQIAVPERYDLLIVSPGGHPKDINVYQAQKALGHATLIMREGGTVIVCAACPEGSGSQHYEEWMRRGRHSYAEVFEHFKGEGFRIGPHKAYQIARDASRLNLRWLSDMPVDFADFLLLNPITDLQAAVDEAVAALPPNPRLGLMPVANATIPKLTQ